MTTALEIVYEFRYVIAALPLLAAGGWLAAAAERGES